MGLVVLVLAVLAALAAGDLDSHTYSEGEAVVLWTNKVRGPARVLQRAPSWTVPLTVAQVGPFPNPQETYTYYSLPFCRPPAPAEHYHSEGLGETILGYDLIRSPMALHFRRTVKPTVVCRAQLDEPTAAVWRYVRGGGVRPSGVSSDTPRRRCSTSIGTSSSWTTCPYGAWWGRYVGRTRTEGQRAAHRRPDWRQQGRVRIVLCWCSALTACRFVFTHSRFDVAYNGNRVIHVNLTAENPRPAAPNSAFDFSYEVNVRVAAAPQKRSR